MISIPGNHEVGKAQLQDPASLAAGKALGRGQQAEGAFISLLVPAACPVPRPMGQACS